MLGQLFLNAIDNDNAKISVTISEAVYNTNGGSGTLEMSDFSLSISGGTATLGSSTPTSISSSGNVYTLGINLSGIPDGNEILTVSPVNNAIFDAVGYNMSTSQSNNTASLNVVGKSLSFDGSDYVSLGANSAFDVNQFTISGWVKKTAERGYIFQAEPSYGYYLY